MLRFSACLAVSAMLLALASAPLVHVHDGNDNGHAESLVHAHFPGLEHIHHADDGVAIEPSDEHGRSIDLFAVNTATPAPMLVAAEFSESVQLIPPVTTRALGSIEVVRAHSPPEHSDLSSRAPPAL